MPSLYLVRHAIAEDRGDAWPDDSLRPLTRDGVTRMRAAVAGLRALDVGVDMVMTSPLLRARRTAELLIEGLRPEAPLIVTPALAPGHAPDEVVPVLAAESAKAHIALVGHEPGLGELASWLIGARAPLAFKKGGVCRIEFGGSIRAGAGRLQWMALPKMLRALGE